jgi:2-polyprenyl-3-methyl-5-hydroxy-6-metoxy-1,4-benzoquinol methylase
MTQRLLYSTAELDIQESQWWQKFADVEEKYCSVQTPEVQRFIRLPYLQDAITAACSHPKNRVLEIGCGTGWLSILMAKNGATNVLGCDFSLAQIQRARKAAKEEGVSHRVQFQTTSADDQRPFLGVYDGYDVVIIHGCLHHLSTEEIKATLRHVQKNMTPRGKLFIFEPVLYPPAKSSGKTMRRLKGLKKVQNIFDSIRHMSFKEACVRTKLGERAVGVPPFGVSPKEIPFQPDELTELLKEMFVVTRKPCTLYTPLVAQELLVMELSYPRLIKLVKWPVLWFARFMERRRLKRRPLPANMWIIEAFECVKLS